MESVSLEDVAVSLTQAEWDLLDPAQRLLYRDVMLEACMHLVFVEVFARGKASGAVGGDVKLLIIEDSTENLIRHDSSNGFGEKQMFPDAGDEKETQKQEQECISLDSLRDSHKAPEGAGETQRSIQRFSEPQSPVAASPVECSSPQQPLSPPRDSPPGDLPQGAVCCPAGQETPSLNPDTIQRRRRRPNIPRPKPTSHDCKVCGETFSVANLLTRHIRENHKETPYVCELCGKGFRFPSYLQAHTETHTDIEKPFKCPECPQSFRYPCKLRAHARVHMEVKPFGCKECGKSFMSSWKLRRHSWIHSGERPYDCPECGKAFHESYLLAKHMRIHTGELPYTCAQCGRGFRWLDSLQIHQVTHTSLSPFQCPECGKAYRCRSYFRVHLKTHQAAQPLK